MLESDIIHVRRTDALDLDAVLHANPRLQEKGLAMVYNPLEVEVKRTLTLPLHYTGLVGNALVREQGGEPRKYLLNPRFEVNLSLPIPPHGITWLTIEEAR